MDSKEAFLGALTKSKSKIKSSLDEARYEIARQGLTKTPAGTDYYLEKAYLSLHDQLFESFVTLKNFELKPRDWEEIRSLVNNFITEQSESYFDFCVNSWGQDLTLVNEAIRQRKTEVLKETNIYLEKQKLKQSRGEQRLKDIVKIILCGIAAGIVGYCLKILISH